VRREALLGDADLVLEVGADEGVGAVVHAVDRVAIEHDSVGLALGHARHPVVPEREPVRPHLALEGRGAIRATLVEPDDGRTKAELAAAVEVRDHHRLVDVHALSCLVG